MKLIVFTDSGDYKHEAVIIQRIIALTQNDVHLYKPEASEKTIATLLASLDDFALAKIVLHHHKQLVQDFPIKGVHKSRFDTISRTRTISLSVHQPVEPDDIALVEYAFFSPIFPSTSKHRHNPLYSVETINNWVAQTSHDYYALSGVTIDRITQHDLSGFAGVAVLGGIWQSQNPTAYVETLLDALQ